MEKILSALTDLKQLGSFCTKQATSSQALSIAIKNFPYNSGKLKFPLSARAAQSLIKLAKPAKFGWKDQTLTDPKVRDVWEITKSHIKIDNRIWNKALTPLLDEMKQQLGLPAQSQLKAKLHNCLIYEPGQFFNTHQDSEKMDGMVATLVAILPSHYRGGALVIEHNENKKRFQASRSVSEQLTLIAFYADCHHQVKPVTEGYRVTLTYNLILTCAESISSSRHNNKSAMNALTHHVQKYFTPPVIETLESQQSTNQCLGFKEPRVTRLIYLLDYQYTQKSLGWNGLKNEDQLRVDSLRNTAKTLNLDVYLALADIQETWACEEEYDSWSYGRRHRSYWNYDDDEDEEHDNAAYTLQELIEYTIGLKHWRNEKNQPVDFNEMYIVDDEVCWTKTSDEFTPFESQYEGYMGNYGNTLDRWYHRAAIVLWRKEDSFAVLCEHNPNQAINEILQIANNKDTLKEAQNLVHSLLPYWTTQSSMYNKVEAQLVNRCFKLAIKIESVDLAKALLLPLGFKALTPPVARLFCQLEKCYNAVWCIDVLKSWSTSERYLRNKFLLDRFSLIIQGLNKQPQNTNELCEWLINHQFDVLKHIQNTELDSTVWRNVDDDSQTRRQNIIEMLMACVNADNVNIQQQVLASVLNNPVLYSEFTCLEVLEYFSSALSAEAFSQWGFNKLHKYTVERFHQTVSNGPRSKDDWSIKRDLRCDCRDCQQLQQFMLSHQSASLIWPMAKNRRRHIHNIIDRMGLPISHETKREGSPHKLMLNKTRQIFIQANKRLENSKMALNKLGKMI